MKRLLIVTSDRSGRADETTRAEDQFKQQPYSLAAIRYNLEQLGWASCYAPLATSARLFKLTSLIDTYQPDIVYTYGGTVALNPLFCRTFLCRHKAFRIIHGWDDLYGEVWDDYFGKLPGLFMHWMEKRIIKNSDGVVTLSYYHQQRARAWGVDCHYIPNGADAPAIATSPVTSKLEGRFNLVYTGDMAKWKRTWQLCAAMPHVPKDIKLYLTGFVYPHMKQYASENCVFLGYLPKQTQLQIMSQADAFVVTADQDCNAKLQEYLRFKKPILGYDGRLNLFFQNGRNALLTRDYASAIQRLANDPALCQSLVQNAEQDIPVYTWREIAQQFDAYFCKQLQTASAT